MRPKYLTFLAFRSFVILGLAGAFAVAASAQFEKGAISGTAKDSTGAVIVGAQVSVTSVDTSAVRTETTNDTGYYTITNLEPGLYEVKLSHRSFGDFQRRFMLSPAARSTVDATLAIKADSSVAEAIDRTATAVLTQHSSIIPAPSSLHL